MADIQNKTPEDNFRHFVRVANTDLDGSKRIAHALTKIKGVSFMFSNLVCKLAKIKYTDKTGYLNNEQVKKLDDVLNNPLKFSTPTWMLNRRKNYETGEDSHLISASLTFTTENDVKRLKKIRSYRGIRHGLKLPVRGQRTKSNFRKNKGKGSLGVKKKGGAKAGRV